jgi:uncharacterized SAM-binding protein YcdF (DUF218 family)
MIISQNLEKRKILGNHQMLGKLIALFLPFLGFIVFHQLHRAHSYFYATIYLLFCIYYCLAPKKQLPQILRKYRNAFKTGSTITLAIIILLIAFPIGGYMTVPLILPHSTESADAVLVLASGVSPAGEPSFSCYQRVIHGAKLLKEGQAKHLYISTGYSETNGFKEYDAVASLTQMLEIPKDKLTIFKSEDIKTTATEAAYAKIQLEAKGINTILLTTSNAHIYRSCLTFSKLGFKVLPAPCHNKETTVYANENLSMFRAAMHEWIGLVWYFIMRRI